MNKISFDVFWTDGRKKSIAVAINCCEQIIALTHTNNSSIFFYNDTVHLSFVKLFE